MLLGNGMHHLQMLRKISKKSSTGQAFDAIAREIVANFGDGSKHGDMRLLCLATIERSGGHPGSFVGGGSRQA
jgi:hypothetical protein